jgi:hypothetical protein
MSRSIARGVPWPPASAKPHSRYRKPERWRTMADAVTGVNYITEHLPGTIVQITECFEQIAAVIERTAHAFEEFQSLAPKVVHEDERDVIVELSGLASLQLE